MKRLLTAIALSLLLAGPVAANDSGYSGSFGSGGGDLMSQARQAIDMGSYAAAISLLKQVSRQDPDDADAYNLLGFSHRKLGQYDSAERFYHKALEIDPEHRGANEYLGELYLETNRPKMAEQRLEVLDDACTWGCKEYDQLHAAIERYRKDHGTS